MPIAKRRFAGLNAKFNIFISVFILKYAKVLPITNNIEEHAMTATSARPMSVKIDPETRTRIEHLAKARHRTTHWIMREAISQYVEREEKREAFRQDAIKAWEEYQETGLHATAAEVDTWLASWGTENELPAPACHK